MLAFFQQYGYTMLIIAALVLIFALVIRSLIRGKKTGKSSCCGGCAGCANACYCHPQESGDSGKTTPDAPATEDASSNP